MLHKITKLAVLALVLGLLASQASDDVSAAVLGFNSQTIGLSVPLGVSPVSLAVGGGDITISGDALLPDEGVMGTTADIDEAPHSDQISIYTVHAGDSLSGIAQMFGVSVNTVVWANDLELKAALKEGQTLLILPVSGVRHIVAKGETLASITKKYGGDIKEVRQFNGLSADQQLAVGEALLIPDGAEPVVVSPSGRLTKSPVRGANAPAYAGYYLRPLVGGYRSQGLHGYNGVDIAAPIGTPLLAAAAGRVIVAKSSGWNGGYAKYVVIQHPNNSQTLYAHMNQVFVSVGETVTQGQTIGQVGMTGNATGPHVHFEIRGAKNPF